MKAPYARVQQTVLRLAPIWEARLGLSHFDIEHVFLEGEFLEESGDDFRVTATAETRWNYLTAKIKWYLPSAVRHDDEELERTLVHELCHVLLAPEQSLIDIELERIATERAGTVSDFYLNQVMFYERLEQATEQVARALLRAWAEDRT